MTCEKDAFPGDFVVNKWLTTLSDRTAFKSGDHYLKSMCYFQGCLNLADLSSLKKLFNLRFDGWNNQHLVILREFANFYGIKRITSPFKSETLTTVWNSMISKAHVKQEDAAKFIKFCFNPNSTSFEIWKFVSNENDSLEKEARLNSCLTTELPNFFQMFAGYHE